MSFHYAYYFTREGKVCAKIWIIIDWRNIQNRLKYEIYWFLHIQGFSDVYSNSCKHFVCELENRKRGYIDINILYKIHVQVCDKNILIYIYIVGGRHL